jgi:hypothetical protein
MHTSIRDTADRVLMAQAAQFRVRPMMDIVTIVQLIRVAGSG